MIAGYDLIDDAIHLEIELLFGDMWYYCVIYLISKFTTVCIFLNIILLFTPRVKDVSN